MSERKYFPKITYYGKNKDIKAKVKRINKLIKEVMLEEKDLYVNEKQLKRYSGNEIEKLVEEYLKTGRWIEWVIWSFLICYGNKPNQQKNTQKTGSYYQ